MLNSTSDDAKWLQVKRRAQARWGVNPPGCEQDIDWSDLVSDVRARAMRVGGHFLETFREAAKETSTTVAKASDLLQKDAGQAGSRAKSAGTAAKTAVEGLADSVRTGLSQGASQGSGEPNVSKAVAQGVGMAAGAIYKAFVGGSETADKEARR